jgi:hypothetical protein
VVFSGVAAGVDREERFLFVEKSEMGMSTI